MPGTILKPLEPILNGFANVAGHVWDLGWAEASAGNISADVTSLIKVPLSRGRTGQDLPIPLPAIAGRRFLVTATGSRFRAFGNSPEDNVCLVEVSSGGDRISWNSLVFSARGLNPTSELPSHLEIHAILRHQGSSSRAILHTHPTHLATISHLRRCADTDELHRLLCMATGQEWEGLNTAQLAELFGKFGK